MSKLKRTCHIKALAENLELALIGAVLASGADSFWIVMDIVENGTQWYYMIILPLLLISTVIITITLIKQHRANVKQELGLMFQFKKDVLKRKHKKDRKKKKIK